MIIPVIFTLSALLFAGLALTLGGWALLLLWPALAAALVGVAYWADRPELFGKRPDGRFPVVLVIAGLPMFGLLYAIWWTEHALEGSANEVAPGIFVGRRPRGADLPAGVETIVDLTAEWPVHAKVHGHPGYQLHRILDTRIGDAEAIEAIVRPLVERRGPMLVHCASGHGRSATIAAAVGLARGEFSDPEQAEATMRVGRPTIRLNRLQRERLQAWFARYGG